MPEDCKKNISIYMKHISSGLSRTGFYRVISLAQIDK